MYSFLKMHIEVTNVIGSVFVFSSGLTSIFYPLLIGYFIERHPELLLYLNIVNICLTLLFFTVIFVTTRRSRHRAIVNSVANRRRQSKDEPYIEYDD